MSVNRRLFELKLKKRLFLYFTTTEMQGVASYNVSKISLVDPGRVVPVVLLWSETRVPGENSTARSRNLVPSHLASARSRTWAALVRDQSFNISASRTALYMCVRTCVRVFGYV